MNSIFSEILDWLNSPVFVTFGAPTSWAEVLGFTTGALCVYLVAIRNIWNWPVGIANNILWIILFVTAGLYADGMLQVVYIGLALYGWHNWLHGGENRTLLPVTQYDAKLWPKTVVAGVGIFFGTFLVLTNFTNSTVPSWDAITTTLSLLAVYGQVLKKLESWFLWMAADIIYVPLYIHKGLTLTAVLYVGFFLLCVYGYIGWRKSVSHKNVHSEVGGVSV